VSSPDLRLEIVRRLVFWASFLKKHRNYFKLGVNEHVNITTFPWLFPNFYLLRFFHDFSRPGNDHFKIPWLFQVFHDCRTPWCITEDNATANRPSSSSSPSSPSDSVSSFIALEPEIQPRHSKTRLTRHYIHRQSMGFSLPPSPLSLSLPYNNISIIKSARWFRLKDEKRILFFREKRRCLGFQTAESTTVEYSNYAFSPSTLETAVWREYFWLLNMSREHESFGL